MAPAVLALDSVASFSSLISSEWIPDCKSICYQIVFMNIDLAEFLSEKKFEWWTDPEEAGGEEFGNIDVGSEGYCY